VSDQDPPDPGLTEFESKLQSLAPARSRLDRDRLMFQAGQAARRESPGRRAWPALAATLAAVALGEGALLATRPESRVVERLVVIREPAAPQPVPPVAEPQRTAGPEPLVDAPSGWLHLRGLRLGPDGSLDLPLALQDFGGPAVQYEPSGRLLRSEIAKVLDPGDPS